MFLFQNKSSTPPHLNSVFDPVYCRSKHAVHMECLVLVNLKMKLEPGN